MGTRPPHTTITRKPVISTKTAHTTQRPEAPMCNTEDNHTRSTHLDSDVLTHHNLAAECNRFRCGSGPISTRNWTDLDAELDRSRRGIRPISRNKINEAFADTISNAQTQTTRTTPDAQTPHRPSPRPRTKISHTPHPAAKSVRFSPADPGVEARTTTSVAKDREQRTQNPEPATCNLQPATQPQAESPTARG